MAPVLFRRQPALDVTWQRVELPDGDFVDLAWAQPAPVDPKADLLVVFPGLGGSEQSKYVRGLAREGLQRGYRVVVLHARGTSGTPNRLARAYHAGETDDPRRALEALSSAFPDARLFGVGFSLGGNVLLRLLAEDGAKCPLVAAAAASVPLELEVCAKRLQTGFSRVYDRYLLDDLKAKLQERRALVESVLGPVDLRRLESVEAFDELVTAPLHGFSGAADYYARTSSGPRLGDIQRPTHVVQALDDPFLVPDIIPPSDALPTHVCIEVSETGGHVGFVSVRGGFWLEQRLVDVLEPHRAG